MLIPEIETIHLHQLAEVRNELVGVQSDPRLFGSEWGKVSDFQTADVQDRAER